MLLLVRPLLLVAMHLFLIAVSDIQVSGFKGSQSEGVPWSDAGQSEQFERSEAGLDRVSFAVATAS